jgi:hypothetical protein
MKLIDSSLFCGALTILLFDSNCYGCQLIDKKGNSKQENVSINSVVRSDKNNFHAELQRRGFVIRLGSNGEEIVEFVDTDTKKYYPETFLFILYAMNCQSVDRLFKLDALSTVVSRLSQIGFKNIENSLKVHAELQRRGFVIRWGSNGEEIVRFVDTDTKKYYPETLLFILDAMNCKRVKSFYEFLVV